MPDRTIVLAENKRHAVRGVSALSLQEFMAYQDDDDALTYTIDMAPYLGTATISTVTRTPKGLTVTNTSNTTTRIIQRLERQGLPGPQGHDERGRYGSRSESISSPALKPALRNIMSRDQRDDEAWK
jgi:hypothetical protein